MDVRTKAIRLAALGSVLLLVMAAATFLKSTGGETSTNPAFGSSRR